LFFGLRTGSLHVSFHQKNLHVFDLLTDILMSLGWYDQKSTQKGKMRNVSMMQREGFSLWIFSYQHGSYLIRERAAVYAIDRWKMKEMALSFFPV
jgi:hypothetical protein